MNEVIIEGSRFTLNSARKATTSYQKFENGSGAMVGFENMEGSMNSVVFSGCHFNHSVATHEGGLGIVSYSQGSTMKQYTQSTVKIDWCTFSCNRVCHGSALYLDCLSLEYGSGSSVVLSNVRMYNSFPSVNHSTSLGVVYS